MAYAEETKPNRICGKVSLLENALEWFGIVWILEWFARSDLQVVRATLQIDSCRVLVVHQRLRYRVHRPGTPHT